ncbi:hypothetical protein F4782DRAFT_520321, partial [Xylaria castorea]
MFNVPMLSHLFLLYVVCLALCETNVHTHQLHCLRNLFATSSPCVNDVRISSRRTPSAILGHSLLYSIYSTYSASVWLLA